ncbi:MAG TPA: YggS family pyridoxal phosphate-dependent enzyme [Taishania sp.]|nr:YggS family pyridoxal phosphate-dependent enzyme [Taishania sp.]
MSYQDIIKEIPKDVTLVAVSKTKPVEELLKIYNQGQRIFGENKVQEMCDKQQVMPNDIEWHLIGHLQTNKVKYIAPFVKLIHAVDSLKLLAEINKQALKNNRTIDCLLQFHIAEEKTKFGLDFSEAEQVLESVEFKNFNNIRICGVMGMATFTENEQQIRSEFKTLKHYFDTLKSNFFQNADYFSVISMGMSGDYQLAIEEGSTMVRIGSLIFGSR